jgi:cysteine desulfurase
VNRTRIYLDHAATTPLRSEAFAALQEVVDGGGFNPSSLHAEGRRARAFLDAARERVAAVLGAARKEIVFTGSGTEADNLAILGAVQATGRQAHIVSTVVEHHAVLHPLEVLRELGCSVTLLPVDERGLVDPERFEAELRPETVLATVMYANNEIGSIQPIAELAGIAKRHGVLFHTDAIQAPSWLPIDVRQLGVDLLSLSAHKFQGPKGVGVLYVRAGTPLAPILHGGGQEFGRRSGTENVAGINATARALELAAEERAACSERVARLRDRLEREILYRVAGAAVNAANAPRLPNISSLGFSDVESEPLLVRLDIEGIAVSAGSACTSGVLAQSHVIEAIRAGAGHGVIRCSLGTTTTQAEVDRLLALLPSIVEELRTGTAGALS